MDVTNVIWVALGGRDPAQRSVGSDSIPALLIPFAPEKPMGFEVDCNLPVKNTFIHFDDEKGASKKRTLRCVKSEPPEPLIFEVAPGPATPRDLGEAEPTASRAGGGAGGGGEEKEKAKEELHRC
eukprot:s4525_g1.t1